MSRFTLMALSLAGTLLLVGCGSSSSGPSYGSEDGKQIALVIDEFNEAKADVKKFTSLFVGPAPKDRRPYDLYLFDLEGAPTVTGDQATAKIKMRTDGGETKGSVEWTFSREQGKWKIKTAPLQ